MSVAGERTLRIVFYIMRMYFSKYIQAGDHYVLIFKTGCSVSFSSNPIQQTLSKLLTFAASHVVSTGENTQKNDSVCFLFVKI